MNYATGQMASVTRFVNTDPMWPVSSTVRTVPVLQRAAWRPWPWRLWGGPSLAYGRSMADYPAMMPYVDLRPHDEIAYSYLDSYPTPYNPYPYATYPYPEDYGYGGYDDFNPYENVGQAAPPDVHAAAQTLATAIHAGAAHGQPPAWRPTVDFQRAFNHAFGPLGGLGTPARPELLKIDGIYGSRTELALGRLLGGIPQVMAMYGGAPDSAATGHQHATGSSPHPYDILSGTTIDPKLAAAVQQLGALLIGRPGVQAIADNATHERIDVFVLASYVPAIRAYIDNVLMGAFMGFPVVVRPSASILAQ